MREIPRLLAAYRMMAMVVEALAIAYPTTDPERSRLIARTPKKAIRRRKFLFDANTFEYI
jgi:hypothetical protein